MLKSASLRGSQVWGRRSERQAGDVTSEMAVTDEFTCGHKKRAFQEERQCEPKAQTQEESKSCAVLDLECICWEGVSPREWQQGLSAQTGRRQKFALHSQENTLPGG